MVVAMIKFTCDSGDVALTANVFSMNCLHNCHGGGSFNNNYNKQKYKKYKMKMKMKILGLVLHIFSDDI